MASLPMTGSKYWGAALNNYLRQLSTDIEGLQDQLNNFTVAASYSGSGWTNGTYVLEALKGSSQDLGAIGRIEGRAPGVYDISGDGDSAVKIGGTVYFGGRTNTTVTLDEDVIKVVLGFGADINNIYYLHLMTRDDSGSYVVDAVVPEAKAPLDNYIKKDGFYPMYIAPDVDKGFKVCLNLEQEYIFNDSYVLIGVLEKITETGLTTTPTTYSFIKRADSAYKSPYDVRRDTIETVVTITNTGEGVSGIFSLKKDSSLTVLLNSSVVDMVTNGIMGETTSETNGDFNYQYPYDYKRFNSKGRRVFIVNSDVAADKEKFTRIPTVDTTLAGENNPLLSYNMLGFFISASGDIFIQTNTNTVEDTSLEKINDYFWDLAYDSTFRTGSLAFIGCCYSIGKENNRYWKYRLPTINGISPAFLTNKMSSDTEVIRLDTISLLTFNTPEGQESYTTPKSYRYNWKAHSEGDGDFKPKSSGEILVDASFDADDKYVLPILPQTFYSNSIVNKNLTSIHFGNLVIENGGTDETKIKVTDEGSLIVAKDLKSEGTITGKVLLINAPGQQETTYIGNVTLGGEISIPTTTDNGKVNNKINIARTITGCPGIQSADDGVITLGRSSSYITIEGSTIKAKDLVIEGTGTLALKSASKIDVNNNILFTSDQRLKKNIEHIDIDACYNAVKNIDVKSYDYIDGPKDMIGIMAQDIEKYLPEYKDKLVFLSKEDGLEDKRSVAEIKLLFILWQAMRKLILKNEG